jgi:hypothetical protein
MTTFWWRTFCHAMLHWMFIPRVIHFIPYALYVLLHFPVTLKYCRALLLRFTEILLHLSLRHPRWIFPWGHSTKHMQKLSLFQCPLFILYILSPSTHISHHKIRRPRQTAHIAYFHIICSIFTLIFIAFGRNIFQEVCSYLLFFFLLRWWEAKFYIHT